MMLRDLLTPHFTKIYRVGNRLLVEEEKEPGFMDWGRREKTGEKAF